MYLQMYGSPSSDSRLRTRAGHEHLAFCGKGGVTATARQARGSQEGLGPVPARPVVPCGLTALRCAPCALPPAGRSRGPAGAGARPALAGPWAAEGAQPGVGGAVGPQKCGKCLWRAVPILWYRLTARSCNERVGGGAAVAQRSAFPSR